MRASHPTTRLHVANYVRIQILKVIEVEKDADIRRPYIRQLISKDLKFPLPARSPPKTNKHVFAAKRPATFF